MNCPQCNASNEADAVFCIECGKAFNAEAKTAAVTSRRNYLFMFILVPILAVVVGLGYYKFFLPEGIAAVVNGEEIKLSELESAARMEGRGRDLSGRSRYLLLDQMIAERIVLQEARKAGISISKQEIQSALNDARTASGFDDASFKEKITTQFGSMSAFENVLARRLLINKFIAEKIVPPGADPQAARIAVDRWYDGVAGKAAIRIALAEQAEGCRGGCSGTAAGEPKRACGKGKGPCCAGGGQAGANKDNRLSQGTASSGEVQSAVDACLKYWQTKHGTDAVTAQAKDFGCHVQVDIIKNHAIIGSLRYQNGSIQELYGRRE